jgi:group I intron endonuclease
VSQNKINGKRYIGKTIGTLENRWYEHTWQAVRGSPQLIHKAIRKYGTAAFIIAVECYATNHDELYAHEQNAIGEYRALGYELYNLTDGGPGTFGHKHSPESKAKQRAAKLGKKQRPETIARRAAALRKPRKYMPPVTVETRAKLSVALKGNPKCSLSHLGKRDSDETKRKKSEAIKRYVASHPGCTATFGRVRNSATRNQLRIARLASLVAATNC